MLQEFPLQSGLRCGEVDVPATRLHHRNEGQCGGHVPVTRPQVSRYLQGVLEYFIFNC